MREQGRRGACSLALASAAALLTLAGCVDARANVIVTNDHDIDVSVQYFLLHADETLLDACEPLARELPAGVGWRRTYMMGAMSPHKGCRLDGTLFLDDLAASRHVRLTHDDGVYDLRIKVDPSAWAPGAAPDVGDARLSVSVTFPGAILSHSGRSSVTGTTITWAEAADLRAADGLHVTARDAPDGGEGTWLLAGGGLAVGLLAGALLTRWLLRRRDGSAADDAYWAPEEGESQ